MKKSWKLIHAVRMYNQDIGMDFGIEKCAMLEIKSDKWHLTDGLEQPSQDKIRTPGEKETNKYLGILEADTTKQQEMKEKNQDRVSQKNQKATWGKTI